MVSHRLMHIVLAGLVSCGIACWNTATAQEPPGLSEGQRQQQVNTLRAGLNRVNGYSITLKYGASGPVETVNFRANGPTDEDLEKMRSTFEKLVLPISVNLGTKVTDAGLAHLKGLRCIYGLRISGTDSTDDGLQVLKSLPGLKLLSLQGDQFTDEAVKLIGNVSTLQSLTMLGKNFSEADMEHIAGLTNLTEVNLGSFFVGDIGLAHMGKMTNLEKLSVGSRETPISDEGLVQLKSFTGLKALRLDCGDTLFQRGKVTEDGLKHLTALTNLETLDVVSCQAFNGEGMAPLQKLPKLQTLNVVYCGKINPEGTAQFQNLKQVQTMRLEAVTPDAIRNLGALESLETLDLSYTSLGDDGLPHLKALTNLKELDLSKCKLTDAGMKHLGEVRSLEKLRLDGNAITDKGLEPLGNLKGLQSLNLRGCEITDVGLNQLQQALPSAKIAK